MHENWTCNLYHYKGRSSFIKILGIPRTATILGVHNDPNLEPCQANADRVAN